MNIYGFFEHGKAVHRNSATGALNESSRSLIWSFWEQKVFLEICEKVSKVTKLDQFWIHPRWSNKTSEICQNFGKLRKSVKSIKIGSILGPSRLLDH